MNNTINAEKICSASGNIVIEPAQTDPQTFGGFNRSERVDIVGNMRVGANRDMGIIYGCMGDQGTARIIFDHATIFIATVNPEFSESTGLQAPTAFGNMVINNLTVKGSINIERPVFATVTSARKVLSVGEEWVTPEGYVRKLMPLT